MIPAASLPILRRSLAAATTLLVASCEVYVPPPVAPAPVYSPFYGPARPVVVAAPAYPAYPAYQYPVAYSAMPYGARPIVYRGASCHYYNGGYYRPHPHGGYYRWNP